VRAIVTALLAIVICALAVIVYMRLRPSAEVTVGNEERALIDQHYPLPLQRDRDAWRDKVGQALTGSASAAGELVEAFENCATRAQIVPSERERLDACRKKTRFWAYIAHLNGDGNAAAMLLPQEPPEECEDLFRTEFWLSRLPNNSDREPWKSQWAELKGAESQCVWRLTAVDRPVRIAALSGEASAATQITKLLAEQCSVKSACSAETTYWLRVAAENGDRSAARELGELLVERHDCEDLFSALFWLNRASQDPRPVWRRLTHIGCF
jgi:TPR repeat protein